MAYELTVALKPDLPAASAKKIIEDIEHAAKEVGGAVEKVESVGIKPLSYPIRGLGQASFSRFMLRLSPDQASIFQNDLARRDDLLRVLMVKGGGGKNG
ncbi:hypothetical protein A2797_00095 [candidate division WWE3 bacterium RIFCSPHIGHO2_01_FULL_48_15]|uniref:Small ribosomal subunit protein bS6 n=1 Tax=candidate division WWE3 bacterium RIFCSPHIGHO2_01_FULL_48_15 TaxID=1802619 RepID=A0A1F4VAD7_UNCKA|nr:MAG: hypothetical protein A2797_00095 [candidate division WWE3 bacterium RIFCSPHIGHO2_01_FULL_48_15]